MAVVLRIAAGGFLIAHGLVHLLHLADISIVVIRPGWTDQITE